MSSTQTIDINTEQKLVAALVEVNDDTLAYAITYYPAIDLQLVAGATFDLTADLPPLDVERIVLVIDGNGATLDGGGQYATLDVVKGQAFPG